VITQIYERNLVANMKIGDNVNEVKHWLCGTDVTKYLHMTDVTMYLHMTDVTTYLHMTDVTMRVSAALCVGRLGCQADCGLERDVKVVIVVVKVGAGDKRVSNSISHRHTSTTLPNAIVQVAFFTHKTNPALCINRILIWQRHALYIVVSKNDMLFRCH
jgi:hypothetical protein